MTTELPTPQCGPWCALLPDLVFSVEAWQQLAVSVCRRIGIPAEEAPQFAFTAFHTWRRLDPHFEHWRHHAAPEFEAAVHERLAEVSAFAANFTDPAPDDIRSPFAELEHALQEAAA